MIKCEKNSLWFYTTRFVLLMAARIKEKKALKYLLNQNRNGNYSKLNLVNDDG